MKTMLAKEPCKRQEGENQHGQEKKGEERMMAGGGEGWHFEPQAAPGAKLREGRWLPLGPTCWGYGHYHFDRQRGCLEAERPRPQLLQKPGREHGGGLGIGGAVEFK